jgi:hypothetical protein
MYNIVHKQSDSSDFSWNAGYSEVREHGMVESSNPDFLFAASWVTVKVMPSTSPAPKQLTHFSYWGKILAKAGGAASGDTDDAARRFGRRPRPGPGRRRPQAAPGTEWQPRPAQPVSVYLHVQIVRI